MFEVLFFIPIHKKRAPLPSRRGGSQKYIFEIVSTRYNNEQQYCLFNTTRKIFHKIKKSPSSTTKRRPQKYIFEIVSTRYNNEQQYCLFNTTRKIFHKIKKSPSSTTKRRPQKYIFEIVSTRYNNEQQYCLFNTIRKIFLPHFGQTCVFFLARLLSFPRDVLSNSSRRNSAYVTRDFLESAHILYIM